MKKYITIGLLILICINAISQDFTSESDNLLQNEISIIREQMTEQSKTIDNLNNDIIRLEKILSQYGSLNSGVANYLTILSIVLTILAISIPLINLFTVIIPNRKIRKKIKKIEKSYPEIINTNFHKYMKNFEKKKLDLAVEQFEKYDETSYLSNLSFTNQVEIDEKTYTRIINKLKAKPDLDSITMMLIFNLLKNENSKKCLEFHKNILEDEESLYTDFSIEYFISVDLMKHMNYLSRIIVSRSDLEIIVSKFFYKITKKYIGSVFDDNSNSIKSKQIGKEKLLILLNNEIISDQFNPNRLKSDGIFPPFLANENSYIEKEYIKDTKLFIKHYANAKDSI